MQISIEKLPAALLILANVISQTISLRSLRNGVVGDPTVKCEGEAVTVFFESENSFTGKVYVKGQFRNQECASKYTENRRREMSFTLELGKCGMQRLRTVHPRGMNFNVVLIVSFHPIFVTSIDRAYNIKCLYKESEEGVRVDLDVSELPTTALSLNSPQPNCEYTVRRDSPNGPLVNFANVGDTVYHVWSCTGGNEALGMLVKQCYVGDATHQVSVVNDIGCVRDDLLLDQLTYDVDLTRAHAASRVFKYADSNQLYFTCQIGMCYKDADACRGLTPPSCGQLPIGNLVRRKRSMNETNAYSLVLDVITPEITVIDLDKYLSPGTAARLSHQPPTVSAPMVDVLGQCASLPVVFGLVALLILVAGVSIVLTALMHRRKLTGNDIKFISS